MPTPDLRCRDCGVTFQRIPVTWTRSLEAVCPNCGSSEIEVRVDPATVWHSDQGGRRFVRGGNDTRPVTIR